MPLDYRSELKRPMSLVLAGAAILGWLVAFSVWFSSSNRLQEAQTERARVQQAEVALRGELDEQRRTSGALAGLQTRVTDAQRQLTELTRSREEAQSRAAAVQQELQTGEQRSSIAPLQPCPSAPLTFRPKSHRQSSA
jgi:DNA repair exonuclease SbcCD ATPase subunit